MSRQRHRAPALSFATLALLTVSALADTCAFTDPTGANDNFDWNLDQAIGTADLTDMVTRQPFYASKYKAVMADARVIPTKRWIGSFTNIRVSRSQPSLFDQINEPFTKVMDHKPQESENGTNTRQAQVTITTVCNRAFLSNQAQLTCK